VVLTYCSEWGGDLQVNKLKPRSGLLTVVSGGMTQKSLNPEVGFHSEIGEWSGPHRPALWIHRRSHGSASNITEKGDFRVCL
jgi:hypothetical protein